MSEQPQATPTVEEATVDAGGQKITPWEVHGEKGKGVDYLKLVNQFGSELIDEKLLARFEKLTGKKPHRWLRRGYFFSHRFVVDEFDNS